MTELAAVEASSRHPQPHAMTASLHLPQLPLFGALSFMRLVRGVGVKGLEASSEGGVHALRLFLPETREQETFDRSVGEPIGHAVEGLEEVLAYVVVGGALQTLGNRQAMLVVRHDVAQLGEGRPQLVHLGQVGYDVPREAPSRRELGSRLPRR